MKREYLITTSVLSSVPGCAVAPFRVHTRTVGHMLADQLVVVKLRDNELGSGLGGLDKICTSIIMYQQRTFAAAVLHFNSLCRPFHSIPLPVWLNGAHN